MADCKPVLINIFASLSCSVPYHAIRPTASLEHLNASVKVGRFGVELNRSRNMKERREKIKPGSRKTQARRIPSDGYHRFATDREKISERFKRLKPWNAAKKPGVAGA